MRYVVMIAMIGAATIAAPRAQEPAGSKQAAELKEVNAKMLDLAKAQNLRVTVESRLTRNAPYSAEAVTESVQQLADGNRIVTKNATRIFRDSDGRTRREQLNAAGTDAVTINISDPVAGTAYVLDPASRMAFRNGLMMTTPLAVAGARGRGAIAATQVPEGGVVVMRREVEAPSTDEAKASAEAKATAEIKMLGGEGQFTKVEIANPDERAASGWLEAGTVASADGGRGARGGGVSFVTGGVFPAKIAEASGRTTREELGQQTIEGVTAVGTRSTTEIAAGAIGNEQPIKIVSEQWFSPELQVLVLTKHTDPRVGETVYRLVGIVRAEPARSLFEIPPDYTLKESAIRRQE
jgi:hypothetical protein